MEKKKFLDWLEKEINDIEAYDYSATTNKIIKRVGQELDRAREEGKKDGLEDILSEIENWKTHYLDTTNSEPSKTMQIGLINIIKEKISKLTTK